MKTLKKYEPEGNISKKLYSISEKIRCEKIGTSYFKGVKKNIEKYYYKRLSGLDLKSSEDKIIESFENYLRVKFLNFKNESQIDKKLKPFKKDLNDQLKNRINDLKDLALDQEKFNSLVSLTVSQQLWLPDSESVSPHEPPEELLMSLVAGSQSGSASSYS